MYKTVGGSNGTCSDCVKYTCVHQGNLVTAMDTGVL